MKQNKAVRSSDRQGKAEPRVCFWKSLFVCTESSDGRDLTCHVVVPGTCSGKDKVNWRLAKHAIKGVNGFADPPSVHVFFAVSALLCEHGNVVRSNLSGVRTELEGVWTTELTKGPSLSNGDTGDGSKAGRLWGLHTSSVAWSRWHVGDVVDIMCDVTETGVVM